jgi:hypothetical protein
MEVLTFFDCTFFCLVLLFAETVFVSVVVLEDFSSLEVFSCALTTFFCSSCFSSVLTSDFFSSCFSFFSLTACVLVADCIICFAIVVAFFAVTILLVCTILVVVAAGVEVTCALVTVAPVFFSNFLIAALTWTILVVVGKGAAAIV